MKQRKFNKKLALNRETLRDMDARKLEQVAGGRPTLTECSNPCPCDASGGATEASCFSDCGCGSIGC